MMIEETPDWRDRAGSISKCRQIDRKNPPLKRAAGEKLPEVSWNLTQSLNLPCEARFEAGSLVPVNDAFLGCVIDGADRRRQGSGRRFLVRCLPYSLDRRSHRRHHGTIAIASNQGLLESLFG